jgi:DNA-binding NarL/FixJ family response regulator
MAVRILLVDDNAIVRAGYRCLLERTPGLIVVGEAEDGDEVLALVERLQPDLVVMDVEMRRVGGLKAARALFEVCGGHPKVLMSSLHGDDHLVAEAFRTGARGYILKGTAAGELVPAVHEAMQGGVYVSRRLQGVDGGAVVSPRAARELIDRLSPMESQLLHLIADGNSDVETSIELGLSQADFDVLLRRVMRQLALHTREELTVFACLGDDAEVG